MFMFGNIGIGIVALYNYDNESFVWKFKSPKLIPIIQVGQTFFWANTCDLKRNRGVGGSLIQILKIWGIWIILKRQVLLQRKVFDVCDPEGLVA